MMNNILDMLDKGSTDPSGKKYEEAVREAFLLLNKNITYIPLGQEKSFQAIHDGYALVKLYDGNYLCIIVDTKAGNAINTSITTPKEKDSINNTINNEVRKNHNEKKIIGYWLWYIGVEINNSEIGNQRSHGGRRQYNQSESLFEKFVSVRDFFIHHPAVDQFRVSIFALDTFKLYFVYLYKHFGSENIQVSNKTISHFWDWSILFSNPIEILDDKASFEKRLKL